MLLAHKASRARSVLLLKGPKWHDTAGLNHDNSNSAHLLLVWHIPIVNSSWDRLRAVVEDIVVQLSVARAKFKLFEEERVVEDGERVEDVEMRLRGVRIGYTKSGTAKPTFFASIRASFMTWRSLSPRAFWFPVNAVSEP